MNIRELTKKDHDAVENTKFSQRLLMGDYEPVDYVRYLNAQFTIFEKMEFTVDFNIPFLSMRRTGAILADLGDLDREVDGYDIPNSAFEYGNYLWKLSDNVKKNSHLYLNYLGMMFGGSIIAKNVPTQGRIYQFENRNECISAIRQLELDADEVSKGFRFHTAIMEELENLHGS